MKEAKNIYNSKPVCPYLVTCK